VKTSRATVRRAMTQRATRPVTLAIRATRVAGDIGLTVFQNGGRPPSWICCVRVWTTHEEYLVVFRMSIRLIKKLGDECWHG